MKKNSTLIFVLGLLLVGCVEYDNLPSKTIKAPKLPTIPHEYEFSGEFPRPKDLRSGFSASGLRLNVRELDASLSNQKVALGRVLFYDEHLSLNNTIACASCHHQEIAFADDQILSDGFKNRKTSRNSLSLSNLGFQAGYFWDRRATDLTKQVMMPIQNHIEMGIENLENLTSKLSTIPYYPELFTNAFGDDTINDNRISIALAQFLAAMVSDNSKYDKGVKQDFANFSYLEKIGREVFNNKGKCNSCHYQPLFTNSWHSTNIGLDQIYDDNGAGVGRFKIPSLRNIELTAPYMHDGRFETLEAVIDHYNEGIQDHPALDWHLSSNGDPIRLSLSVEEKIGLVAFLKTLTDYEFIEDERFSNPF